MTYTFALPIARDDAAGHTFVELVWATATKDEIDEVQAGVGRNPLIYNPLVAFKPAAETFDHSCTVYFGGDPHELYDCWGCFAGRANPDPNDIGLCKPCRVRIIGGP